MLRAKNGSMLPLELNPAQQFLHEQINDQLQRQGLVRKIILKGRQQGISTYIQGRAYHRTTFNPGTRASIMTHHAEATDNLFLMAKRFHENCPAPMKPTVTADSGKRLAFGRLDSDYTVATAGTSGVGRSSTLQYFHGSEVAYWPHADSHVSGIMQAVAYEPGTEAYLESTANGPGDYFHKTWQQAVAGEGDWEPVFIPWFWQPEYVRPAVDLDDDEIEYARLYNLADQQMAWRRAKIIEFKGDVDRFRREYPATPEEAFQISADRAFLKALDIEDAMIAKQLEAVGPKLMGVDVARFGDDRTAVSIRQGRCAEILGTWGKTDTMDSVGRVKRLIDQYQPDRVWVDVIGVGAGVVDRLHEMGYHMVEAASASNAPLDTDTYINKRGEMYGELRAWLEDRPVGLVADDGLRADLAGLTIKRYDSKGRIQLETKDEAKARGIRSPDLADSLALTFYEPFVIDNSILPDMPVATSWLS